MHHVPAGETPPNHADVLYLCMFHLNLVAFALNYGSLCKIGHASNIVEPTGTCVEYRKTYAVMSRTKLGDDCVTFIGVLKKKILKWVWPMLIDASCTKKYTGQTNFAFAPRVS